AREPPSATATTPGSAARSAARAATALRTGERQDERVQAPRALHAQLRPDRGERPARVPDVVDEQPGTRRRRAEHSERAADVGDLLRRVGHLALRRVVADA